MRVNKTPTFTAGGALASNLRVKLNAGKIIVAGATDNDIGTTDGRAFADGDLIAVVPMGEAGVRKMVAAGVIAKHAAVFSAASGKISTTGTTGMFPRGIAMEAATGDGSIINVLCQGSTPAVG